MLPLNRTVTLLAILLLEGIPSGAAAVPRLVPLSWTSTRIGRDKCSVAEDKVTVELYCQTFGASGCLSGSVSSKTVKVVPVNGVVDLADGPLRVVAVVTNSLQANSWTAGVTYARIDGPAPPLIGSVPAWSVVRSWTASFFVPLSGAAILPAYDAVSTSDILIQNTGPDTGASLWAQGSNRCGGFTAGVDSFLAGDTVVLERGASVRASSSVEVIGTNLHVSSITIDGATSCADFRPGSFLPNTPGDCQLGRLDLFSVPPPSSSSPKLACKSDLDGDGIVNFADLAKMKSVFFKSCTP